MADDRVGDKLFEVENEPVAARTVTPVGAHKRSPHYDQSQSFLLPPSVDDWLPENHEARFISDVVDTLLDLDCIYDSYTEASGAPPYDPAMMLKLLLFAYSIGVTSSREMERRRHVDVAFRWLSANAAPDYRPLSRFRRRHLSALDALLFAAGKLGSFATSVGLELDPSVVLAPWLIERFIVTQGAHLGPALRRTLRSNLRFLSAACFTNAPPAPAPLSRERAKAPYAPAEWASPTKPDNLYAAS